MSPCSPGWTRTNNPSVNSRMLCLLSYRGRLCEKDYTVRRGGLQDCSVVAVLSAFLRACISACILLFSS